MNKLNKITEKALNNLKNGNKLKEYVINYINEHNSTSGGKTSFTKDLLNHGCVSGMVGDLVYYSHTTKFYNEYKDEIWELIMDVSEEQGMRPIELIDSLRADINSPEQFENCLAWFGFEEIVRQLVNDLGIEL